MRDTDLQLFLLDARDGAAVDHALRACRRARYIQGFVNIATLLMQVDHHDQVRDVLLEVVKLHEPCEYCSFLGKSPHAPCGDCHPVRLAYLEGANLARGLPDPQPMGERKYCLRHHHISDRCRGAQQLPSSRHAFSLYFRLLYLSSREVFHPVARVLCDLGSFNQRAYHWDNAGVRHPAVSGAPSSEIAALDSGVILCGPVAPPMPQIPMSFVNR